MKHILGLGSSETRYGQYSCVEAEEGVYGLISVGSDPDAPSIRFKGSQQQPNEDCYLILADERSLLIAVADSHFGHQASHELLERLSSRCSRVPLTRGELALILLGLTEPEWEGQSESTLLVAVLDRQKRAGFGYQWGDSSLLVVGPEGIRPITFAQEGFLAPGIPPDLEHAIFAFTLAETELLTLYTDGVNECHYRNPQSSIAPSHLIDLYKSTQGDAKAFATAVMELSLAGVEGNPGGQDNVALVVVSGRVCTA